MKVFSVKKCFVVLGFMTMGFAPTAWALKFDSNVPKDVQQQMIGDLAFMETITGHGASAFHEEIFGQVDGQVYSTFFNERVHSVGMGCGGGNAVACVIPFYRKKMWITENYIKFSHPQISRMMIVFHEARHTEASKGHWAHDRCPVPFLDENGKDKVSIWTGAKLEGEDACDSTYKGSYGSSTVMLKNIAKFCSNCNEKVKMDANIYGDDQLGRISRESVKQAMINDFNAH